MGGDAATGRIDVRLIRGDVIECVGNGYITFDTLARAHAEIERIMADVGRPVAIVRDASAVDGVAPGLPIASIRWTMRERSRLRASCFIARGPTLLAVGAAYATFIPTLRHRVVRTRAEAIQFVVGAREPSLVQPGR